ncbi:MAG: DinB family protein [Gemmatimonadetes bacterium]|nr:DinB family protein [Gemmatimonadota bacterium]
MTHYGSKELAASFRTVRMNTLETARDIPADQYDYTPTDICRSVGKLLTHIALGYRFQYQIHAVEKLSTFVGFDFLATFAAIGAEEAKSRTPSDVIELLETEGEVFATFLDGLSDDFLSEMIAFPPELSQPPKSRLEMLLGVKEHEMHHRGQLMVYQRMLGIVPHLTRQREARAAERA